MTKESLATFRETPPNMRDTIPGSAWNEIFDMAEAYRKQVESAGTADSPQIESAYREGYSDACADKGSHYTQDMGWNESNTKASVLVGSPSPGTSANSDGGEWEPVDISEGRKAYEDWLESQSCEYEPPEWDELIDQYVADEEQFAFRAFLAGCEYSNPKPAVTTDKAPVLLDSEQKEPQPTSTNQEKIPASKDPEGKEK